MSILITRPLFDITTHYFYYWSKFLIEEAEKKSLDIYDLKKGKVTKKNVVGYLKKNKPTIVIFNGHGNSTTMAGHENEELITVKENSELLKKKNVFMRACSSGKELGKTIMEFGAKGFIGYKEDFIFPYDKEKLRKPLEDELAAPCLECSNHVALALIKGHSVKESHEASMKVYKKKLDEMFSSESKNTSLIWTLQWNMLNQVCYSE